MTRQLLNVASGMRRRLDSPFSWFVICSHLSFLLWILGSAGLVSAGVLHSRCSWPALEQGLRCALVPGSLQGAAQGLENTE